ncbi:hypothetical protein GCM10010361_32040 [Streptomyces olivaceiscleroticus]|uniref:Uncharacterized protein n=1 Tax=Streptomyces olivaceiscleroticus TaxID=68245 RepID=A0ABN1A217_9ACTN
MPGQRSTEMTKMAPIGPIMKTAYQSSAGTAITVVRGLRREGRPERGPERAVGVGVGGVDIVVRVIVARSGQLR